jgi:hypothetical protein
MRSIAINVAANTNEPGFRGPIADDGSFVYVPIPESEPTTEAVPTYADLSLPFDVPDDARDRPVHLDPEFAEYSCCERYTYGDNFAVKAGPLTDLSAGDYVFFYATLSTAGDDPESWIAPDWGTYVIGHFELARDPVDGEAYHDLSTDDRAHFANNAHVKRDPFDAKVLLAGDPDDSLLYDRAIPLSSRSAGVDANHLVTELSADSGAGPWWRRPLRFDAGGTEHLLSIHRSGDRTSCFAER